MSERDFDVNAQGLDQEVIQPIVFGFFDFLGDAQYVHTGIGYIAWGGKEWVGVGDIVSADPVTDDFELRPGRIRLSMAVTGSSLLQSVLDEQTVGRRCEIYLGNIDIDTGLLVDTPNVIIVGVMGPPEFQLGDKSGVAVEVTDIRADFNRINGVRSCQEDHQEDHPGDLFYEFLPKMVDHKFVFNGLINGGTGAVSGGVRDAKGGTLTQRNRSRK